jgi:hypothetical protein
MIKWFNKSNPRKPRARVYRGGKDIYIPLQQAVNDYYQEVPKGWYQYIEEWVNEALSIKTGEDYHRYLEKTHMRWFNYEDVIAAYANLKRSKYDTMFEDDILRYIAYMYASGFFKKYGGFKDIYDPDIDDWLNFKGIYKTGMYEYSLMDLLPLKHGQNAIRWKLVFAEKWL